MESNDDDKSAQRIFVKADEVDAGTSILSPGKQLPLSALAPADASAPAGARPKAPPRPLLRRDGSAPLPPSQPPPAPPVQALPENPTDSLSLPQLRQIVSQFPKVNQKAYAYQYSDSDTFQQEIEEWFRYNEQDRNLVLSCRDTFESRWKMWNSRRSNRSTNGISRTWEETQPKTRKRFLQDLLLPTQLLDVDDRVEALECFCFILLGAWSHTAGTADDGDDTSAEPTDYEQREPVRQIEWMNRGSDILARTEDGIAVQWILGNLHRLRQDLQSRPRWNDEGLVGPEIEAQVYEMKLTLTCIYVLVEVARFGKVPDLKECVRGHLMGSPTNFLIDLMELVSRFRWEDDPTLPLTHFIQLLWKGQLLMFGGLMTDYESTKSTLLPSSQNDIPTRTYPVLTASPLDYHFFRQEITSKYPAYNPPAPVIPLENEHRSMLPLLSGTARHENTNNITAGLAGPPTGSILHQPVHIATPAPSPPPSPIGPGGKAGKKQNYQTNQNFPFLYPPLDGSSNLIGGKGTTEFQDAIVGRKWEGSDIPYSIMEAGELFASRIRMSRAVRQLWRERMLFMRYERGWRKEKLQHRNNNLDEDSKDPDDHARKEVDDATQDVDVERVQENDDLRARLDHVDGMFHRSLMNLQSFVIVLMKVMLKNVQEIAIQNGGLQDVNVGGLNRTKSAANMTQNNSMPLPPAAPQPHEMSIHDLEMVRSREISMKAITGAIFVMLKWFKLSHVLKFEYITQLLLDSNYLQLTLKYFAHQNLEDLVGIRYDRQDLSFFHFCRMNSDNPPPPPDSRTNLDPDRSEDDAVPPPIPRHGRSKSSASDKDKAGATLEVTTKFTSPGRGSASPQPMSHHFSDSDTNHNANTTQQTSPKTQLRPTVDELGNPTSPLPSTPITNYSQRIFQTAIHLLRILQKLTRNKSHRVLLLVQFKSSQILRRLLRIPDPTLRLYVLKLFKSQVPYCGRKWRQSNMRVITAVYLHVKPELRDEWLVGLHDASTAAAVGVATNGMQQGGAGGQPNGTGVGVGGGAEGDVDEAVPMEWALRGLTYWWMKRCYPDIMKLKAKKERGLDLNGADTEEVGNEEWEGGQEIEDEERDFFQKELDAMGWGVAALGFGAGDEVDFGEEAPGVGGINDAIGPSDEGVETI